jgi:hypothetical protein
MASTNDVTGDKLQSKSTTKKYRDNWDLIYNKSQDEKLNKDKKLKSATK